MARKQNYDDWSREELVKEITRIKETTYGLVWHRDLPEEKIDVLINPDARTPSEMFPNEMNGKPFPVLKEVKGKNIQSSEDNPTNILIEGDNYHSLAVLNFTHQEAIDLIYIDPPYNTGNNDFTYNDKIVDNEDPFRHSKWLSFMERRLKLAKNLLKDTGTIFISIDDHEQAQLRMLCDEIFGESNFIANFVWNSTKSITNPALVSVAHTYNFVYAKDKSTYDQAYRKNFKLPAILEGFDNPDDDLRGPWKADPFEAGGYRPNQMYEVTNPLTGAIFKPSKGNCWKNDLKKFTELVADNRIVFGKDGKGRPQRKRFIWEAEERGLTPNTWWDDVGTTTNGTMELKDILGDKLFSNPKPVSLIRKILLLGTQKDSIVLDFFAGSGTTAHAVLDLNKSDDGNRRFILCTNNENEICSNVCYPRITKVMKGYTSLKKVKVPGLGGNLRYYTCDFVEAEPSDKNKRKLVNESTDMLCIKEDTFEFVEGGEDFKIFKNSNKYSGIVFHEDAIEDYIEAIKKIDGQFNTYVFSLGDEPHEREFVSVKEKVTLCAIPEVILKVYREIFK
jgi:adenine-specific DNA-methyltransferase